MFRDWLIRLPLISLIASLMGYLGLVLMFVGGPWIPGLDDFYMRYVMLASVLLWAAMSAALGRSSRRAWAYWGLASPLLGCLLVVPPASFAFVLAKFYIAFPVGLATGLLCWSVFHLGPRFARGDTAV